MPDQAPGKLLEFAPAVFYADILVNCPVEKAWQAMLDYQVWNPTFAGGGTVTPVSGEPASEGELVYIEKKMKTFDDKKLPGLYAETVKVVPHRHIAWYSYPKDCDDFRNFADFWLEERPGGVKFHIFYYAQFRQSRETLREQAKFAQKTLQDSVEAFKKYCEGQG